MRPAWVQVHLRRVRSMLTVLLRPSTPVLLATVFASVYLALGPGCFFSVDEVAVEEMAQAVLQRGTLEIPAMNTAIAGRENAYYGHRGPALAYISLPFVWLGTVLDNQSGSLGGGVATGPALGTLEHPLRWGGRFTIFTALIVNAVVGGLTVAMLYLIALRFGAAHRIGLAFACATGSATLLVSESTHFFQHPLEAFTLLAGFWFLSDPNPGTLTSSSWLGGLSLGLAVLARPNTAPAVAVLWIYGVISARRTASAQIDSLWRWAAAKSAAAPAMCTALYLIYNYIQYGGVFKFGYGDESGILQPSLSGPLRALTAYLVSPALSVFLFAPLMLLVPILWKQSLKRRPLEVKFLMLAAFAHFAVIALVPLWDGAIAYGPRYVLAPMLLLLPLALPAFEKAFGEGLKRWRLGLAGMILIGALVQIVGLSVYVSTNEWYYNQQNIYQNRAFIFIPSASPVWVQLRDLVAGRNIIPWLTRAVSQPGPALVLLAGLLLTIAIGLSLLRISRGPDGESDLPGNCLIAMGLLVVLGFCAASPVVTSAQTRVVDYVNAGLAAQQANRDVGAQELYALVLGLDPQNKFALHNLALLYEKVGNTAAAVSLYRRAVEADPTFAPSAQNLLRYTTQPFQLTENRACNTAPECYESGRRRWDLGDKAGALEAWGTAASRFPSEVWLVRNVARARYDLADYEGAIRDYRRAVSLSREDLGIRTDLAWALLAAGHFEEARLICNEVLGTDHGNVAALTILGRLSR